MTHDHVHVMLAALLAIPMPGGYTSAYRERRDTVTGHTFRDVVIAPNGVDVGTFTFGTPGAYAHISVDDSGAAYTVGVLSRDVGYNVQAAGHVVAFTTADDAVRCALGEIRGELERQQRRW